MNRVVRNRSRSKAVEGGKNKVRLLTHKQYKKKWRIISNKDYSYGHKYYL